MSEKNISISDEHELNGFLKGKPEHTLDLFHHFITAFAQAGPITIYPAKSMIGIANSHKRIAWITQLGKNFVHIVLPFPEPYETNLCFQKIAQVPGDSKQFNHHLRIYLKEDINDEVMDFIRLAYKS
jgi:hypothetical protein